MSRPQFFSEPFRYIRWAHVTKPAIFYSLFIGTLGPVIAFIAPPLRHRFGDHKRPEIPLTYPIPNGPRKQLSGYDDPK